MSDRHPLAGVYAAALTPLNDDFSVSPAAELPFLSFLAARGCHGALLFGTTGEGPSFAPQERIEIMRAAVEIRKTLPDFRLLVGTGTPSLEETVQLTKAAFELGFDGVLSLPPYYYRQATDDGLFAWFDLLIRRAVPEGGNLFGYHFPGQAGIGLSLNLLVRLKDAHPQKFVGIKDSSGDAEFASALGTRFGPDLLVLTGSDRLCLHALKNQAGGAITAMSNLYSPLLRQVWDAYQQGHELFDTQEKLAVLNKLLGRYTPYPAILKSLLARQHGLQLGPVRPPLTPVSPQAIEACMQELSAVP